MAAPHAGITSLLLETGAGEGWARASAQDPPPMVNQECL